MWVTLKCGMWCVTRSPTHKDDFVNKWKGHKYILTKQILESPKPFNDELRECSRNTIDWYREIC